ncbi:MAG TPA: sigma-70 family RNA polymerase sigma factor [Pseudonocardiaceae bacterium]
MRDDPTVVDLVGRARDGDQEAWEAIVERYATLVWSVCRRHGLSGPDADDVNAAVWLRLVENLGALREPAALAGWLRTTTRRECLAVLRGRRRQIPVEDQDLGDEVDAASDEWLLREERHIALREAFDGLSERCRELLSLLFADPPLEYKEISARLGMKIGAIGPNRQRCLERLRGSPGLAALLAASGNRTDRR